MKNTKQLFIATALFLTGLMNAQVGIGTTTPAASAELDITSTTKGFLPPRMSVLNMIAIPSPALGLTVYCTDCATKGLYTNQAEGTPLWQIVSNASLPLDATGNTQASLASFYNGWTAADPIGAPTVLTYSGTNITATHTTGQKFSDNSLCGTVAANKLISRNANPSSCPTTVTGLSGIIYPTIFINGQCWMKTNLKEIPSNFSTVNTTPWLNTATSSSDLGYWGIYNSGDTTGATGFGSTDLTNEGYLYQWRAAMNGSTIERAQGACPTGWHIPSECEYMYLEHGIGMSLDYQLNTRDQAALGQGDTSVKLRNSGGTLTANNASGFSLLLVGKRNDLGVFGNRTSDTFLWTSSIASTNSLPIMRYTNGAYRNINRGSAFKGSNAISVRCLKD